MSINFPNSPSDGDNVLINGITYTYDATKSLWKTTAASGATVSVPISIFSNTANSAFQTANSSFEAANTAFTVATSAFGTANTATTISTSAFGQANTATTYATSAFSTANIASTNATNAYNQANIATTYATSAFSTANTKVNPSDLTTANVTEVTNLYFTNARSRSSISSGTGVIYNSGTGVVSIGQGVGTSNDVTFANVTVTGNLLVQGNSIQFTSNTLVIQDPLIQVGKNPTGDAVDLGFFGHYIGGSPSVERHAGLFRDASDGQFKLFSNLIPEPVTIVDTANTTFQSANLVVNFVVGKVTDISNHSTTNLSEGTNLYFTNTRAIGAFTGGSGMTIASNGLLTVSVVGGVTSVAGATGAVSNAQLLAGLLTVDGVGSSLDADLLDGLAGGGSGFYALKANNLSVFANTTSTQLASIVTDETGSGNLVFSTSPTLSNVILSSFANASGGNIWSSASTVNLFRVGNSSQTLNLGSNVNTTSVNINAFDYVDISSTTGTNLNGAGTFVNTPLFVGSGTLAEIYTNKARADVFNTATTGNIFTSATVITVGASTGTTTVRNNLLVGSNISGGNVIVSSTSRLGNVTSGVWLGSSISTTYTDAKVTSVNGQTGAVTLTTANVSEVTNLYFTNTRAISAFTGGSGVSIASNGRITATVSGGVSSVGGSTGDVSNAQLAVSISRATVPNLTVSANIVASNVIFRTPDTSNTITLTTLNSGILSFTGNAGQLFSITDNLTGTIFSVNDVSGIPSIEVMSDGRIIVGEFAGNVLIGSSTDTTGKLQLRGTANIVGDVSVIGNVNIPTTKTTTIKETTTISATGAASTINFDVLTQTVELRTGNATGNWTLNVRGNSSTTMNATMAIGESISLAFLVTNGSTPYYQTGFTIDGSSRTIRWQGGSAPSSGNANSTDAYSFTIIKTANDTYTVLGSVSRFA